MKKTIRKHHIKNTTTEPVPFAIRNANPYNNKHKRKNPPSKSKESTIRY